MFQDMDHILIQIVLTLYDKSLLISMLVFDC
jgi:hypothetical protein